MSGQLWIHQPASAPSPLDIAAYLVAQGWSAQEADARWAVFVKELAGKTIPLEVPQQAAAGDYPRAVGLLFEDLARIEDRPESLILRDVKSSAADLIRLAIESSMTRDGRIPVEAGRRVYEAARDLLLAAACSVIDPRAVFAKRKPDDAMALLNHARFGHTEIGSFVLTIESDVSPRLQPPLVDDEDDRGASLERKTFLKLASALEALETATRASAALANIDPFREHIRDGVSANLCDAVAEILEATGAEALRASFSFATRRPVTTSVPRHAVFTPDTVGVLREAAARLRDEATYPDTDLVGPVVKLTSYEPAVGGEVVLQALLDGQARSVIVKLDQSRYAEAIRAHGDRELIRCSGELAREGRSWVLREPHGFTLIESE